MLIQFAVPAMVDEAHETTAQRHVGAPNTDVIEDENQTVAVLEVPGVDKSDVKVSFDRGVLTVTAERKPYEVPEKGRILLREQTIGVYRRSMRVQHPVEVGNLTAHLADGILRVTLPKAEVAKPRVIEVR
jgi:HSP20 family molecular chaperone IbpA